MKLQAQLLAALVAGTCAISAQAQSDTISSGLYVGGSIGQSKVKNGDFPGLDGTKASGKLYAGYDFSRNFALELGYVDLGDFGFTGGSVRAKGMFLDAVGTFPITPQWAVLARAGAFKGKLDTGTASDTGNSWKAGLGVQYNLTQNASIRTEYERYRFNVLGNPTADVLTVGVNYRF
jgi:OOP family OmpA-OmpF porin